MAIPDQSHSHIPSMPENVGASDERPTGPVPTVTAATPGPLVTARRPPRLTAILLSVIVVLVIALGVMTALWISTNGRLSAIESTQAAVEADQAATPDLLAVAKQHLGSTAIVTGDSESVSVVIFDSSAPGLRSMLGELGFSSAVLDRMGRTRALDGTREAQGKNCNVTWTYHPDDGLQMVFEVVPPG